MDMIDVRQLLILLKAYMIQVSPDSLDQQRELYQRVQSGRSNSPSPSAPSHPQLYKQFYRQQLDELVQQKAEQRRVQRQQQQAERNAYNDRITQAAEAERLKDLSYKNYYNMLLDNQTVVSRNYVSPFDQNLQLKDRLVRQGVQQGKRRSDQIHEQEVRRQEEARKSYRESLAQQINQKYNKQTVDTTHRVRENEEFKKITYSPQELAKFERERRVAEMQRYREDLDRTNINPQRRQRSSTNYQNDFNVKVEERHNPMVNPLPFNIQNPYILRQMQRRPPEDSRYY